MAALWAAQRQKRRRIVYCFNILIDFVLQYTIQRACQNMKIADYLRIDVFVLVRECKETLQRGVKEIDRGIWQERCITSTLTTDVSVNVAILIKSTFGWLGVLWVFLGSSLVLPWSLTRGGLGRCKGREILIKVLFWEKYPHEMRE